MSEDRFARDLGAAGSLEVVARWDCPGGVTLRVVRWRLQGPARALVLWARGVDVETGWGALCLMGVALERRDSPLGRWQTVARQEVDVARGAVPVARLRGWEAGLVSRGAKLAARLQGDAPV